MKESILIEASDTVSFPGLVVFLEIAIYWFAYLQVLFSRERFHYLKIKITCIY